MSASVMETWEKGHLDSIIENVFGRIKKVLVLIVEGKGSNKLVETKRGKKHILEHLPPEENAAEDEQRRNESAASLAPPPVIDFSVEYDDEDDGECELIACEV